MRTTRDDSTRKHNKKETVQREQGLVGQESGGSGQEDKKSNKNIVVDKRGGELGNLGGGAEEDKGGDTKEEGEMFANIPGGKEHREHAENSQNGKKPVWIEN